MIREIGGPELGRLLAWMIQQNPPELLTQAWIDLIESLRQRTDALSRLKVQQIEGSLASIYLDSIVIGQAGFSKAAIVMTIDTESIVMTPESCRNIAIAMIREVQMAGAITRFNALIDDLFGDNQEAQRRLHQAKSYLSVPALSLDSFTVKTQQNESATLTLEDLVDGSIAVAEAVFRTILQMELEAFIQKSFSPENSTQLCASIKDGIDVMSVSAQK